MVKIGLLSDTHSHWDEPMIKFLEPVDEIWHAGDIGNIEVVDVLQQGKTFRGVYGNIDGNALRQEFSKELHFTIEQVRVFITHIGGYPGKYAPGIRAILNREKPQLFISGHSHILKVMHDKALQCLHMNPGAAGISGFHQVRTMLRFVIDGNKIQDLEVWEYPRK